MKTLDPKGIMTALLSPNLPDGSLNLPAQNELIEHQIRSGVTGVCATAGAGEYITLTPEERVQVTAHIVERVAGRVPVIAGVLAPDTGAAVKHARAAVEVGADALLVCTPFYIAPSAPGLVEHFRRVNEAARDVPIILYNIPSRTGINMEADVLEKVCAIPAVVGVKECDRDLGRVVGKINRVGHKIAFLSGDDDLLLPFLCIGGNGAIMSGTNLVAPWAVAIYQALQAGNLPEARRIYQEKLIPYCQLFRGADHPGPLKQILQLAGFPVGPGRAPLQPVSADRLSAIKKQLIELGLISN